MTTAWTALTYHVIHGNLKAPVMGTALICTGIAEKRAVFVTFVRITRLTAQTGKVGAYVMIQPRR